MRRPCAAVRQRQRLAPLELARQVAHRIVGIRRTVLAAGPRQPLQPQIVAKAYQILAQSSRVGLFKESNKSGDYHPHQSISG